MCGKSLAANLLAIILASVALLLPESRCDAGGASLVADMIALLLQCKSTGQP